MKTKKTSHAATADSWQRLSQQRSRQKRKPRAPAGQTQPRKPRAVRARFPHDASRKRLFSDPDTVASLLRDYVARETAEEFGFSTLQRVSGSYASDSMKLRSSDLVWQVSWKDRPFYVPPLLEAQSQPDCWMALRMLCHSALLRQEMGRTSHGGADFRPRP